MRAVVIYESLTGTTRRAAYLIADEFFRREVGCRLYPAGAVDPEAVATADLVVVGTWTDGFILIGQRPGRKGRLKQLPDLTGRRCVAYITYAVDHGRTLEKLTKVLEEKGAEVVGGLAIRRDRLREGAVDFVDRVLAAVEAPNQG